MPLLSFCSSANDPNYLWLLSIASAPAPTGPVPISMTIDDKGGSDTFLFDTTRSVSVFVTVQDPVAPTSGALIQILETSGDATGFTLFQATSSASGNVQGSFTVNQTTKQVTLRLTLNGTVYNWLIDISNVQQISRFLFLQAAITVAPIIDTDGDGVADDQDAFPLDPTRSATVHLPAQGFYTVAYEDLFPVRGDADFNDYVRKIRYEEDLNANGQITRVRGYLQHLAHGAGYSHTLNLTLAGVSNAQFHLQRFAQDGTSELDTTTTVPAFTNIQLMPNSSTTITSQNANPSDVYKPGKTAQFEITLTSPVAADSLGTMPLDLSLHVINTNKDIHFLGRYKDANGKDLYLDPNGFPWALMIPGSWQWPYERGNIHQAYLNFQNWYSSAGVQNPDWYLSPVTGKVFPH